MAKYHVYFYIPLDWVKNFSALFTDVIGQPPPPPKCPSEIVSGFKCLIYNPNQIEGYMKDFGKDITNNWMATP